MRSSSERGFAFDLNYGNLGIGLDVPDARLHVANSPYFRTAVFGSEAGNVTSKTNVSIGSADSDARLFIGKDAADFGEIIWRHSPNPSEGYLSISSKGASTISLQESGAG
ncbi:MAG: hypothetical protein IPH20_23280 [Bacteroidales bacterium]|nr:hypothetical protein [Bacteroidales bacterium]